MILMERYRTENGGLDWSAYNKAQVDAGEKCCTCGAFIASWNGHRQECYDCRAMHIDNTEITHGTRIRCPHCRTQIDINEDGECGHGDDIYREGTHEITCYICHENFEIETQVTFTFTSPAVIDEDEEEEDVEDDDPDA